MKIPYYHVDVFTSSLFNGNPAGVCILSDGWLEDDLMQNIAAENKHAETAFVIQRGDSFELRWFTPEVEMDLCGHATVAPAHVLFNEMGYGAHEIHFETKSGRVSVSRSGSQLILDFPSRPPVEMDAPDNLESVLGAIPVETLRDRDFLIVFENEKTVRNISPDFVAMKQWN